MMSINTLLITHEPIVQTAIHAVLIDATDIQVVGSATCYQQVYLMDFIPYHPKKGCIE